MNGGYRLLLSRGEPLQAAAGYRETFLRYTSVRPRRSKLDGNR